MKKQILAFVAAACSAVSFAQSVPNGSFENWQNTTVENPQFFTCANDETHNGHYSPIATVTKTTDAYHGSFALRMVSTLAGPDSLQAYIADGNPGQNMSGGIPYSQTPTGLRFYYKNNPAAGDSALVLAIFKKNGSVIGQYVYTIGGNHSSYTLFSPTFSPALATSPDTLVFACASSNLMSHKAIPGSMFQLDSVSFTGVASQPSNFNGDFELWQNSSHYNLVGWNGDQLIQTTDKYKGTYAVELVTNPPGFGENQIRVGNMTTGHYQNNGPPTGGMPFSNQIDTLVVYYKYLPANYPLYTDSAQINMTFSKNGSWFSGTSKLLKPSISNYIKVEMPFNLFQAPDTVQISVNSSKYPALSSYVGSDLKIDQMYFKSQTIPVSFFKMPATGCKGVPIQLVDSSSNMPISWQWFMTGASPSNSSLQNPTITYANTGTFTVSLQAADSFGTGAFISKVITIYSNPVVTVSSATVCSGNNAVLTAGGASTYTWTTGTMAPTITVNPTSTTNYSVTGTSTVGCSSTVGTSVVVPVPATPDICILSVDSLSNNNMIYWNKTLYTNVDSFIIYREVSTGVYSRIGAVSKDSLSQFKDVARNVGPANGDPSIGNYRYKIQIRDTCGVYGPLSKWHNTVKISDQQNGTFSWNTYDVEGQVNTPVANFILERDNANNGTWTTVGIVSGTQTSTTDPFYGTYQTVANWRVQATGFNCTPSFIMGGGSNSPQAAVVKSKSNITNNRTMGIKQAAQLFSVYPNPSTGLITLKAEKELGQVVIMNALGEIVYQEKSNSLNTQVDLGKQPAGVYTIMVQGQRMKLVKE